MSGQQDELDTSRFVSAQELEAGKQLEVASQDGIKGIILPVEQIMSHNPTWENKPLINNWERTEI